MGEAKRRRIEIENIKTAAKDRVSKLAGPKRVVAEVAIATFEKFVMANDMVNGCYQLAFFLSEYLLREKQIETKRVFGWVTNAQKLSYGMAHAWIEFNGQITDVSIFNNESPDILPPGAVLVHGINYREGILAYEYHVELPRENRAQRDALGELSPINLMELKRREDEFSFLKEISNRPGGAHDYFSEVLADTTYDDYKATIETAGNGLPRR